MTEPPDKPGSDAPVAPGEPPRATTTQPLAPVDPSEVPEGGFETTGTFRTTPISVPVLDAPFPVAPPPPAPARPPAGPSARPPPVPPRSGTPPPGVPAAGPAAPKRASATAPGIPAAAPTGPPRPPTAAPPARVPTPGAGTAARTAPGAAPGAPGRPPPAPGVPRTPAREQPAAEPPQAPLGTPTGEFLTEQARAASPPPQPGVVPARVFRPGSTPPAANPPLPSLGVNIAPAIAPLAPVKQAPRPPGAAQPRAPRRPAHDPMSETSLGIPVMAPLPPGDVAPLPPLPVRVTPLAPPVPPAAAQAPGDPEDRLTWKAERLDTLDYFELLGVPTTASGVEVKRAFYRESRAYHPDRFFHLEDEAYKSRVHEVYKRVTEAYYVLRDDVRRPRYLADITGPDRARKLRFDETSEQETKAAVKQQAVEQIGLNPKARQLYQTALGDLEKGNLAAAERGLKMALTYEPQNALYKEKLTLVQGRLYEESRGKAFKIT